MSIVRDVLTEEYERLIKQTKFYSDEISKLPKGTVQEREIRGGKYYYLKYREGVKVKSVYIKDEELDTLKSRLKERKRLENILMSLKEDEKILRKVVKT